MIELISTFAKILLIILLLAQSILLLFLTFKTAQIHKELINLEQKLLVIVKQDLNFLIHLSKLVVGFIMKRTLTPTARIPFWYKFVKYVPGAKRVPNIDTMYKPFHSLISSCIEIKDKLKHR